MEKRYNYIYWDLDGTLWQHKPGEVKLFAEVLNIPYTKKLEEEFFYMIGEFNRYFADKIVTQKEICKIIERTMSELSLAGISGRKFLDAWSNSDCNTLNKDAKTVLSKLRDLGKQNNVLTDWLLERQIKQMKEFGIFEYMDNIYSCEENYLKKNPLSSACVINSETQKNSIIIGDSLSSDIAFANHAGIDSIWYNPNKIKNMTSLSYTFEVTSLLEILDIIK